MRLRLRMERVCDRLRGFLVYDSNTGLVSRMPFSWERPYLRFDRTKSNQSELTKHKHLRSHFASFHILLESWSFLITLLLKSSLQVPSLKGS